MLEKLLKDTLNKQAEQLPDSPELWRRIQDDLTKKEGKSPIMFTNRRMVFSTVTITLIVAGLMIVNLSPKAQAWASDSWSRLFMYKIVETQQGPAVAELTPEELKEQEQNPSVPKETVNYKSLAEASQQTGLPLSPSAYVPKGSKLTDMFGPKGEPTVNVVYTSEGSFWVLTVSKAADMASIYASFEGEEVRMNETTVLVGNELGMTPPQGNDPKPAIDSHRSLMWKNTDGVIYKLTGTIPLEEMKKVATSLTSK